ncbi:hypothetical protein [Mesoplasma melaleucae]|uniref:Uncharacterized protein n=1 Tax=Mesoplasma melaleucae TaxID=81459 RepID=A0A2K8NVK8_9MOLU|nr:hypothetical protein [Mesoplasma melaleucae]ATZ17807.1 hypothetical protein EMELA_v1c02340 [Mesoplasma melaleucae]
MKYLNMLKITAVGLLIIAIPVGGIASYNILVKAKKDNENSISEKYKPLSPFSSEFKIEPNKFKEDINEILKNFTPSSDNEITSEETFNDFIKTKLIAEHGVYKSFKQGDNWKTTDKSGNQYEITQKDLIKIISNKNDITDEEYQLFKLLGVSQSFISYMYYKTIYDYNNYRIFQENPKYNDFENIEIKSIEIFNDYLNFYKALMSTITNSQTIESYLNSKEWIKAITLNGGKEMSKDNKNYIQNLPFFFSEYTKFDWKDNLIKATKLFSKLSSYASSNKLPINIQEPKSELEQSSILFDLNNISLTSNEYNLTKIKNAEQDKNFINWSNAQIQKAFNDIYTQVWKETNFDEWNYQINDQMISGKSLKQGIDPFGDRNNIPMFKKDFDIIIKQNSNNDITITVSAIEGSYFLKSNTILYLKNNNQAKEWNSNLNINWVNNQLK